MDFEGFRSEMFPWAVTGGAGLLGRLMFHARQVQRGVRKPFSWVLLWDLPVALGMGWIALGLGIWLDRAWEVTVSIALVASYLGPHSLDSLFVWWGKGKFGDDHGKTP